MLSKKKKNAPFILRELQRYLIHIFARCFKQVLWMVVGGREGWGTLACRLEEISAGVRGRWCIFLFFLCLWLPHAAKFPSDLPIECLQISAVQEACNPCYEATSSSVHLFHIICPSRVFYEIILSDFVPLHTYKRL